MVVVWGGANDIARNEANNALTHIINSVKSRKHTNVLLVSVPTRFDLLTTSCVNRKLHKWMKQYEHVEIIDCELQRKYFTRHGMHMNLAGKELIAQRIMKHLTKRETSTITLQWKQKMDKRTASTWEYDPGNSTNVTTIYIQENQTSYLNNNNSKNTTDTNSVIGCSVGKAYFTQMQ